MERPKNAYRNFISEQEALKKAFKFCAYQERCVNDLQEAFKKWQVNPAHFDGLLDKLVEEDFLNEQRFADAFVSGRFRIKFWGRVKIEHELKTRNIPKEKIDKAMRKIDSPTYMKTAERLMRRKMEELYGLSGHALNNKIVWYMVGKGYEKDVIFGILKNLNKI